MARKRPNRSTPRPAVRRGPSSGPAGKAGGKPPTAGSRRLADGHSDRLQPVRSLDLSKVAGVDALVRALSAT
jgi:hypothetical protein